MIVSAFIPIIWIIIFISIFFDIWNLLNGPIFQINSLIDSIINHLKGTTDFLIKSVKPMGSLGDKLFEVTQEIKDIPIEVKTTISGRDIAISIPGLKEVKSILESNLNILNTLTQVVSKITSLSVIQQEITEIQQEVTIFNHQLQEIAVKILALIVLAVTIIIPLLIQLLITPYIRWANHRIRRGWELTMNNEQ